MRVKLNHNAGGVQHCCHPSTSDRIYNDEEMEFLNAIQAFKAERNRPFPTWSEALGVLKGLGYQKDATTGTAARHSA